MHVETVNRGKYVVVRGKKDKHDASSETKTKMAARWYNLGI